MYFVVVVVIHTHHSCDDVMAMVTLLLLFVSFLALFFGGNLTCWLDCHCDHPVGRTTSNICCTIWTISFV